MFDPDLVSLNSLSASTVQTGWTLSNNGWFSSLISPPGTALASSNNLGRGNNSRRLIKDDILTIWKNSHLPKKARLAAIKTAKQIAVRSAPYLNYRRARAAAGGFMSRFVDVSGVLKSFCEFIFQIRNSHLLNLPDPPSPRPTSPVAAAASGVNAASLFDRVFFAVP